MSHLPVALFLVQNLSLPMDRRVWQECQALVQRGWRVYAVCPRDAGQPKRETLDGVTIYRYAWPSPGRSVIGFAREFSVAWIRMTAQVMRVLVASRVDVVQYCNPPDTMWTVGLLARLVRHSSLVFDQHDLSPEIYAARGGGKSFVRRILQGLEVWSHSVADLHVFPNESYRERARDAGMVTDDDATLVVMSVPDASFRGHGVREAEESLGHRPTIAYIGIMGPQDNVDVALRALAWLKERGHQCRLELMGWGECEPELRKLGVALGLTSVDVEFVGRVDKAELIDRLSKATVGVAPDLPNPLADISTHNKVLEYIAVGLPFACFPLKETRRVSEGIASFACALSPQGLGEALLDALDPTKRPGRVARARHMADGPLSWDRFAVPYEAALRDLAHRYDRSR